jgi:xanthine dehydrogenase accessory factor
MRSGSAEAAPPVVLVRGAGDAATAIGRRLHLAGFRVVMTELPSPLCIRRTVAFSEAVYEGEAVVEGVRARLASAADLTGWPFDAAVAVVVDDSARVIEQVHPQVLIDARILKRKADTDIRQAPIVGVLGPGWRAGVDCHFVVETKRGHDLGRVIYDGEAEPDTGAPEPILGVSHERALYAGSEGIFEAAVQIGDSVQPGTRIGRVAGEAIVTRIAGTVRGVLRSGTAVAPRTKVADVDPRNCRRYCFTISDKSNSIAGGVLEGVFALRSRLLGAGVRGP